MPDSLPATIRKELFPFEIELDQSGPIPIVSTDSKDPTIRCKFRHFNEDPIKLSPGTSAGLAIGYRIYDAEFDEILFEHRASSELDVVAPERWVDCAISVPHALVRFDRPIGLMVDMLRENEYWFAASPELANRFSVDFADIPAEQDNGPDELAGALQADYLARVGLLDSPALRGRWAIPGADAAAAVHLVFDVSDLVQYFQDNRLPTGIQRVQIEVITSILASGREEFSKTVACFTTESGFWVPLDIDLFEDICRLALTGGDLLDRDWRRALEQLKTYIGRAPQLVFPQGAFLINLGSSWWLPNYFLNVRLAKARSGIKYVPFVHDCIPIVTPEHCVENLTCQFIGWALGALELSDHTFVNSKTTATDLLRIAKHVGKTLEPPAVVELNASFNAGRTAVQPADGHLLLKHDLRVGEYVLFVATIESRKNHQLAFSAWIALLKKFGARRVPKLVCVGKKGWLCDAVYARLEASSMLRQKVVMLSGISDSDLQKLYQDCLFTIYPSYYEGWGLPVTESLCSGKVPLLSRCSSLPEAGGDFAEYFELDSEAEFVRKLERLIFDAGYRETKERKIAAEFKPRTWSEIGAQFLESVRGWAERDAADPKRTPWVKRDVWPVEAVVGRYYPMRENRETQVWPGIASAEMFRQGDAWWSLESWGCWAKHKVARLGFLARVPSGGGAVLFLGVRGLQKYDCTATITLEGVATRQVQLRPYEDKWLIFRVDRKAVDRMRNGSSAAFELLLSSDRGVDFRELTKGLDKRISSIGVLGLMLCEEGDLATQVRFIGSAALGDMESLIPKPEVADLPMIDKELVVNGSRSRKRRRPAAADLISASSELLERAVGPNGSAPN